MRQLIIEPEFRDKIPRLSPGEFSKLEENILADGEVREPLVVWNDTIVDGHHRWAIIQKHSELHDKFTVKQMEFPDRWAAIVWMCRNQLGRRNITNEQKTALIAEAYKAQRLARGGARGTERDAESGRFTANDQNGRLRSGGTKSIISKGFGVGDGTVQRAIEFMDGLEAAEKASPGIKDAVLSGEVKAPKKVISGIRNLPDSKKKETADAIMAGDIDSAKDIISSENAARPAGIVRAAAEPLEPDTDAINKAISDLYDTNRVVVHTVDDLLEDLASIIEDFKSKAKRSLVIYSTTLQTTEDRNKVRTVLEESRKYICELEEIVL